MMKKRRRVAARLSAAPPKALVPDRQAAPATPFLALRPRKLRRHAVLAPVRRVADRQVVAMNLPSVRVQWVVSHRNVVAMVEIERNPPRAPAHRVAQVRRIVPDRNVVATAETAKTPLSVPAHLVARGRVTVQISPSARVRPAAQVLATAPGRETALRVPQIAQVHHAVPAHQVVVARESPAVLVRASVPEMVPSAKVSATGVHIE